MKMIDIDNEFIDNIFKLIDLKICNNTNKNKICCDLNLIETQISQCKEIEKQNRNNIIKFIRFGNDMRKQNRDNIINTNIEINELQLNYNLISSELSIYNTNKNHIMQIYNGDSIQYKDLISDIDNLNDYIINYTRKQNRLSLGINDIKNQLINYNNEKIDIKYNKQINIIPFKSSFKDLISSKNKFKIKQGIIINECDTIDKNINDEIIKYNNSIIQLKIEDSRANERLQIIISRCTDNYNEYNNNISSEIIILTHSIHQNCKQLFIKNKELDNLNIAFKNDCHYEFRKLQLNEQLNKLITGLCKT